MDDTVQISLTQSIEFRRCSKCGATTIVLVNYHSLGQIEIDPLPVRDGYVLPDFARGRCKVIPIKQMKNYPQLWQPHAVSCSVKEVTNGTA